MSMPSISPIPEAENSEKKIRADQLKIVVETLLLSCLEFSTVFPCL